MNARTYYRAEPHAIGADILHRLVEYKQLGEADPVPVRVLCWSRDKLGIEDLAKAMNAARDRP